MAFRAQQLSLEYRDEPSTHRRQPAARRPDPDPNPDPDPDPDAVVAQATERLGFHAVSAGERLLIPTGPHWSNDAGLPESHAWDSLTNSPTPSLSPDSGQRRRRWPHTANPHLLVSRQTAAMGTARDRQPTGQRR
ncbi:hypothetical protein FHR32_008511 [Streptosporangium album]|uniref:Uncharacterized protein n=1 Tax=Streptosporangium album TaxID=47479 RepID=A0A7W7S6G1_9ACTN|nr:hypothetical protein [Streptosporangium album]MBB4944108.1 hypothetical protein [Streptosporangium album]